MMKAAGALGFILLSIIFVVASCSMFGYGLTLDDGGMKIGRPRDYAEATGVAMAADMARAATGQAISDLKTAQAISRRGTATAQDQIASATATAVPYQAAVAQMTAYTGILTKYTVTVFACGMVPVLLALAAAGVSFARVRARLIPRGKDGQLPGIMIGNTTHDPARSLGQAFTVESETGLLWNMARAICFIRTGELMPVPDTRIQLADGHADADHYLEAARIAGAVGIASATFRPDNVDARRSKVELIRSGVAGAFNTVKSLPQTRVIITGDSAIESIAKQLGDNLPEMLPPGPESKNVIEGESE